MWNPTFHLQPPSFHLPHPPNTPMAWCAHAWISWCHSSEVPPQQGAAVKISSSVFLCDLGLPWAHALRTNLCHQPCYGYNPTALTSWMLLVFSAGWYADMSSTKNSFHHQSNLLADALQPEDSLYMCLLQNKNLNLNTSKSLGYRQYTILVSAYRGQQLFRSDFPNLSQQKMYTPEI